MQSEIIERLRFIINTKYNGKNSEFAKALDVPEKYVSQWLRGRKFYEKTLEKMRQNGINTDWLLTGKGKPFLEIKEVQLIPSKPDFFYKIAMRHAKVPVNAGKSFVLDFMIEYTVEPEKYNVHKYLIFDVNGDSMEPTIPHGSRIIVEETTDIKDGKIVVGILDGALVCKVFRKKGEDVWLESINPNYPPEKINGLREFKVIGVVRKVEWIP